MIHTKICRSTKSHHLKPYNNSIENVNILVAEDQEFNLLLLKTILEKAKAKVSSAKNGVEVLDFFFDKKEVDIVLMDLNMPKMDGYETIQQLKKLAPEMPIIVQTANAMTGEMEKCLDLGADDYIAKPIDQTELILKIAKLVNKEVLIN
ncbi:response regulator [Mangrovibacterium sp.]|uniref:response regulator n=1 Tax=Mangrovibacterium sp. TaxID=1961364 RepID=UPI00356953A5